MREVEDSGIDVDEECIVKATIDASPLTVRIKIPKTHRTYTERKQALKSNLKRELRKTEKFFQIVSLPEKKDVVSPSSFFSRSTDPVLPDNKVENRTNEFDKLNATVPLTLSKNYNIINKKHRKVTLNAEAMQKLEKYSKKLNKFLTKKGLRKLSKPEKKHKKCLESVSKVKRVKNNPVNYRELYNCLISKRSMEKNPRLFSERLESMIDLRYDFNYEKRSYYKARKIVRDRIKKLKYPPIKIKISLPSHENVTNKAVPVEKPVKIPRVVARSSSPCIKDSTKQKSISRVSENIPEVSALPRIPRKSKVDDTLKKDHGALQSSSSSPAQSSPHDDSPNVARSISTETEILLIAKEEEEARKKKEREESEERKRQIEERERFERRNKEIEMHRISENKRQAKEAADKKRREKELLEQALKNQEEEAKRIQKAEEISKIRSDIEKQKEKVDEKEKEREKLKQFKEQTSVDYAQIQKQQSAHPRGEPPMKMVKLAQTPQSDSAFRSAFVEKDATTTPVNKHVDNSISPTFAKPTINKDFHFDRQKPPKVRRHFPTKAEKEQCYERFYSFQNCNIDTARKEAEKYRADLHKTKQVLEFDENGPPKGLSIQTFKYSAMKMVNGLLGVDDYYDRDSKMFNDDEEWDYSQITYYSLRKKYEWPFGKTNGVYWPIVIDHRKSKNMDEDSSYIRRLLKNNSYSGRNLASYILNDEPIVDKARGGFLEAYMSSGTEENSMSEWEQYNAKGTGRFANRTPYKTISTDQTREDGIKKHNDRYGREMEHENRYLEARNCGIDDNYENQRRELISHCVQASRIDVYSLRETYRSIGERKESIYVHWTDDGYDRDRAEFRDRYLGIVMNELTKDYDELLEIDHSSAKFDRWFYSPMLVSLFYQISEAPFESYWKMHELADLKARKVRYNEMCKSRYPTQTKLSLIKHMCKLTDFEKRFWTILYDNLISHFKDLPTLSQLMDRREYSDILNNTFRDAKIGIIP